MATANVSSDPIPNDVQPNCHTKHADPDISRRSDPSPPPRFPPTVPISTALLPSDDAAVPDLLNRIQVTGKEYTTNHLHHDTTDDNRHQKNSVRLALLAHARALVHALETPRETMIKHCWAEPSAAMCLAVGVDTGLFHHLSCDDAGCPCMKGRQGGGGGERGGGERTEQTHHRPVSSISPPAQRDTDQDPNNPSGEASTQAATAAATAAAANRTDDDKNNDKSNPKSLPFLSHRTGIPVPLLSRLLRHLTAMSHIRQPTPTTFLPTPFSS
ncbi:hypothetical protein KC358_g4221, partial [Hortaea werneckii]